MTKISLRMAVAGAACGVVNGLFGAGGGMILVPLLAKTTDLTDRQIFPASISIVLPICLITLSISAIQAPLPWHEALPYLIGSLIGGLMAGKFGGKIPTVWLHRSLGALIIWGGLRYLC